MEMQVVAVANDITFNSGAFGPREDAVFRAVTEYAMEERLPLLYLAANSGARVGLANEIKKCLQVGEGCTQTPNNPFSSDFPHHRLITTLPGQLETAPLDASGALQCASISLSCKCSGDQFEVAVLLTNGAFISPFLCPSSPAGVRFKTQDPGDT